MVAVGRREVASSGCPRLACYSNFSFVFSLVQHFFFNSGIISSLDIGSSRLGRSGRIFGFGASRGSREARVERLA